MENRFIINNFNGKPITVKIKVGLYSVKDYMGRDMLGLAIELYSMRTVKGKERWESFGIISKNFGEYIGTKNAVYIDLNNCPYAEELLKYGVAVQTPFKKRNGYCVYPVWKFDSDFLNTYGGKNYKKYSKEYDEYMASFG